MVIGGEATLKDLLVADDLDPALPRLLWMVLTWDLAKLDEGRNDFYRVHLTQDALLATGGKRTPVAFNVRTGKPGKVEDFTSTAGDPLSRAVGATAELIMEGYGMVCLPLAVDCSGFADRTLANGNDLQQPRQLLDQIAKSTDLGLEILRYINDERREAIRSHIDEDWESSFPGTDPVDLFMGM